MRSQNWGAKAMSSSFYNVQKALQLYSSRVTSAQLSRAIGQQLPAFARSPQDGRKLKSWSLQELPLVGEKIGFLRKPTQPVAIATFVTKGGVLKTSLTLNLARLAALHGIRTCVVGLDMQGDITSALGFEANVDDIDSLDSALEQMNSVQGLAQVFSGESTLAEVIQPTDLPTLFFIPETPELVALDQSLMNKNRREHWLKDHVVDPLKKEFDLVIMDCSPNWNRLITNALVACDLLISPVECKINNFRNLKIFQALLSEFRQDLRLGFDHVYVPTRLSPSRKLSQEIYSWYQKNLPVVAKTAIRESVQGEESTAMHISVPEYQATAVAADEMRELLSEIWAKLNTVAPARTELIEELALAANVAESMMGATHVS
jgi:chromosome partitioning protein